MSTKWRTAEVDRTNASRNLNLLAQEGKIERIPGHPVLFTITSSGQLDGNSRRQDTQPNKPVDPSRL